MSLDAPFFFFLWLRDGTDTDTKKLMSYSLPEDRHQKTDTRLNFLYWCPVVFNNTPYLP